MTKTMLIILVCTAIIIGGLTYVTLMTYPTSARTMLPFQQDPEAVHYSKLPKFVDVPSLGVHALVEIVGRSEDGHISLPVTNTNVGWYGSESRLGERGSIVIAGLDKTSTGLGVFHSLANLKQGDIIKMTDTSDMVYTYVVDEVGTYEWNPESRMRIFNLYEKPYLNLIVYGYSYESQTYVYPQTVVYAHFKAEPSK